MKTAFVLFASIIALGCTTVPGGWDSVQATNVRIVSDRLSSYIASSESDPQVRSCLLTTSTVGSATYVAGINSRLSFDERMRKAVKAARRFAKTEYPSLEIAPRVVANAVGAAPDVTDAELMVALVQYGFESGHASFMLEKR